jgi:hypothetical protein
MIYHHDIIVGRGYCMSGCRGVSGSLRADRCGGIHLRDRLFLDLLDGIVTSRTNGNLGFKVQASHRRLRRDRGGGSGTSPSMPQSFPDLNPAKVMGADGRVINSRG